jgi:integrase/recombinase XerD
MDMLRAYFLTYQPATCLLERAVAGERYSERCLRSVFKQALQKAGITQPAALHWLRHCYAKHLLKSGTDLRYIQEMIGHKGSCTNEIYTHVSQRRIEEIRSPISDIAWRKSDRP